MQHTRTLVSIIALGAALTACGDTTTDTGATGSIDITTGSDSTDAATDTTTDGADGTDSTDLSTDERIDQAADALKNGDFTTMLRLLELSGLADDIEGREITILAPTEDAFADVSSDELANLLTNPTEIDDVLKGHILDELLTFEELATMTEVTTMTGETLPVTTDNGGVQVDGAEVTERDADSMSGEDGQEVAVFAIDRVLLEGS